MSENDTIATTRPNEPFRKIWSALSLSALLRKLIRAVRPIPKGIVPIHRSNVEDHDPQARFMMACSLDNPDIILPPLSLADEVTVREYLRLGKELGFLFSMMHYGPIIEARHIRIAEDFIAAEKEYVRLGYKPISTTAFVSLAGWHKPLPETDQACQKLADGEEAILQGEEILDLLKLL